LRRKTSSSSERVSITRLYVSTREATSRAIANATRRRFDSISDGGFVELLVCDGDERLGNVSLAPINERRGWANLGYWIHPTHQGKKAATEAARLAVTHGFEELRLHRISAAIVAHNEASKRVVEKLGFVHEGTSETMRFIMASTSTEKCTRFSPKSGWRKRMRGRKYEYPLYQICTVCLPLSAVFQ
jgi:RimJ/RimL family protein N-acetyltransferase